MKIEKKINIIFDFDGVIVNSNSLKTDSFESISQQYGYENSKKLVNYHIQNGGISRFKKIRWFVENVLKKKDEFLIKQLIEEYGKEVTKRLDQCELRTDLIILKNDLKNTLWSIASGGFEDEILSYLRKKSLTDIFESGIYGSPASKMDIIKKIKCKSKNSVDNCWFLIGDSKYDYKCAKDNNIKFIFASDWSEINDCKSFISENQLSSITGIEKLNIKYLNNLLKK